MRTLIIAASFLLALFVHAEPAVRVTQIAELAEGLSRPHDAAMSPDGKLIYVTDMQNSRIRVVDAMTLESLGVFGDGELSYPHDAEFDRQGRLLVADTGNDRVAIYRVDGASAILEDELTGLSNPEGVAVAPDGRVIATNTRAGSVSVFRDGKLERTIGRRGANDGEFSNPHDVEAAADGTVYVVDSGNDRVQVFDADLNYQSRFSPALALNEPKYLAFDGDTIWLADEYNHRILRLDAAYNLIGVLGTGQRGRSAGAFYKPEAVLARAPYVWVIDTYNDRIVLLRVE